MFQPTKKHRSEEHTSELQSLTNLVCRLLLEKKQIKLSPGVSTVTVLRGLSFSSRTTAVPCSLLIAEVNVDVVLHRKSSLICFFFFFIKRAPPKFHTFSRRHPLPI